MANLTVEKVYAFTNENVSEYEKLYNYNGAKILSVLGSGDQYFASKLFGASEVVLYDTNPETWDYFVFKFYAIMTLSYEDFVKLTVYSRFSDRVLLNKVYGELLKNMKRVNRFINVSEGLRKFIMYSALSNHSINYASDRIIPYFDREKYYKLQTMLRESSLPKVHFVNLIDLPAILGNESFDIIFTSNIFTWLGISPQEYLGFLRKFKSQIIQAHYVWHKGSIDIQNFKELGFIVNEVPTVALSSEKNYVITNR